MKKYFSAKNWVSADAYYSYGDINEIVNILVPVDSNLDLRIGETIIPTYELLKDLTNSCIKWIKEFHGTFEDSEIPYEIIFDVYEEVKNNEFFVSWILSKEIIPSKSNEKQYENYKKAIENGVVMGNGRIFGYTKKDGKLVIDEKEAEMVRMIYEL